MADEVATGGAATEAPAAAGGSAASASGAGAASVPAAPAAGAGEVQITPGKSNIEILREAISRVPVEEAAEEKPAAEAPAATEGKPAEAAKPAEGAKPEEGEAKPEGQKAADDKAAEPDKKADEDKAAGLGPLPATKFAEFLKANPDVDAALEGKTIETEAGPIPLKQAITEAAKLAGQAHEYAEIVGTPDDARSYKEAGEHFFTLDEKFPAIQTVEDLDNFVMDVMVPLSVIKDPKTGEALRNPDGSFKTDGSVARFFMKAEELSDGILAQFVETLTDADEKEEAQMALKVLADLRAKSYGKAKPAAAVSKDGLPPEVQERLKRAEQIERDAAASKKAEAEQKAKDFEESATQVATTRLEAQVRAAIDPTALSDKLKPKAVTDIWTGLADALAKDKPYLREKDNIYRQAEQTGFTEEAREKLAALTVRKANFYLPGITQRVLDEYGAHTVTTAQDRNKKIDTQTANDKPNATAGTVGGRAGSAPKTDDEVYAAAVEAAKKAGHDPGSGGFNKAVLMETMRLRPGA